MIRIKAVDAQNLLDVCQLKTSQNHLCRGCSCCNAVSIAEAKYCPELHPNAVYHNNTLIGFFMYQRPENHADTAAIRRFMIDSRFQQKGLAEKALEHILGGLKIQGVRKVDVVIGIADEEAKQLYLSFGFSVTEKTGQDEYCCTLEF